MEDWRSITGFPDYQVSTEGRVRNIRNGYILTPSYVQGFKVVPIRRNNRPQNFYVHRLVAQTFIEPDIDGKRVTIVNGNKEDCSIRNLKVTGLRAPKTRGTGRQVRIKETGKTYNSVQECADAIGGRREGIYGVLAKRAWTYRGLHFEYVE